MNNLNDGPVQDRRAQFRRERGIPWQEQVPRDTSHLPHPSSGGTRGYSLSERLRMLQYWGNDLPVPPSMLQSIRRWSKERVVPYRMTGNKGAPELSGEHLLLLVIFKLTHPEALLGQCVVFIAMHLEDAVVFQELDIARALKRLGCRRKMRSTVAKQAFTQVVIPVPRVGPRTSARPWKNASYLFPVPRAGPRTSARPRVVHQK